MGYSTSWVEGKKKGLGIGRDDQKLGFCDLQPATCNFSGINRNRTDSNRLDRAGLQALDGPERYSYSW